MNEARRKRSEVEKNSLLMLLLLLSCRKQRFPFTGLSSVPEIKILVYSKFQLRSSITPSLTAHQCLNKMF